MSDRDLFDLMREAQSRERPPFRPLVMWLGRRDFERWRAYMTARAVRSLFNDIRADIGIPRT